ncbi:MAG: class I SAM-dependent methyltransferase [Chromatiaceae bacterium]
MTSYGPFRIWPNITGEFRFKILDGTRCYSLAVFERDDEALATAECGKLSFAVEACGLRPGDRVRDAGGG